jgi:hypothetical protein
MLLYLYHVLLGINNKQHIIIGYLPITIPFLIDPDWFDPHVPNNARRSFTFHIEYACITAILLHQSTIGFLKPPHNLFYFPVMDLSFLPRKIVYRPKTSGQFLWIRSGHRRPSVLPIMETLPIIHRSPEQTRTVSRELLIAHMHFAFFPLF